jgi:polar amino acid transport system substrate-binding protein
MQGVLSISLAVPFGYPTFPFRELARGLMKRRTLLAHALGALGGYALPKGALAEPFMGQAFILNTAFGTPISNPDGTGFFDRLMHAAFGQLGVSVAVQHPPAERALILANAGIDDGDGPRIPGLDTTWSYPNLVRVPEKLLDVEFAAFSLLPGITIDGWADLSNYEIGIVTGWKILERHLHGHKGVLKVKDSEHLFQLLKNRRAQVVVIDRYSGIETAHQIGLFDICISQPVLDKQPMYLYLNVKHADMAAALSATLGQMKRDGRYEAIFQETLGHVVNQYCTSEPG